MSQSTSLIDNNNNNNINVSVKPNDHDELSESSSPMDKSPFRKIEFHHAKKPFTAFTTNDAGTSSFQLETINPTTTHNNDHHRLAFEFFFDPDNNFRITFIRIVSLSSYFFTYIL